MGRRLGDLALSALFWVIAAFMCAWLVFSGILATIVILLAFPVVVVVEAIQQIRRGE